MAGADRCACCGKIVPEGRQVCPSCQGTNGKRLIDANALIDKFWQEECRTQTRRDFVAMVNYAPTVDAVEVDHTQIVDGECKKCGWFGDCVEARSHNFCPGCGRKVRRAEDA